MTGESKRIDQPVNSTDNIVGTAVNDTNFVVWTSKQWYLYTLPDCKLVESWVLYTFNLNDRQEIIWLTQLSGKTLVV